MEFDIVLTNNLSYKLKKNWPINHTCITYICHNMYNIYKPQKPQKKNGVTSHSSCIN